jgi:hypothetical protein
LKVPFTTSNGSTVEIDIDEVNYIASVSDLTGDQIGKIEFRFVEGDHPRIPDYLKMTHAFLEGMGGKYKGQGIGTRCVELMIEATDCKICVSPEDEHTRTDGSHLIGDGPRFARKLKRLKLAFEC